MIQMLPSLTPAVWFRHLRYYLDFGCPCSATLSAIPLCTQPFFTSITPTWFYVVWLVIPGQVHTNKPIRLVQTWLFLRQLNFERYWDISTLLWNVGPMGPMENYLNRVPALFSQGASRFDASATKCEWSDGQKRSTKRGKREGEVRRRRRGKTKEQRKKE